MPLRNDILKPVPGDNPSGRNLRSDPVWDKIKEARRQDDDLAQGVWQRERKTADYGVALRLTQDAIATESKDLQLAAWLTEALLKVEGLAGFASGLDLCRGMVAEFWETIYPAVEDDDLEDRAAPIEWIARLLPAIKSLPLSLEGRNYFQYKESRTILTEELAKTKEEKSAREKALKEGKTPPEVFDKAFAETPKAFYAGMEKQIDVSLAAISLLDAGCKEKFGVDAPGFGALVEGIREVRQVVHALLEKKRETDPDPIEEVPMEEAAATLESPGEGADGVAFPSSGSSMASLLSMRSVAEPAGRREAIEAVVAAAAFLRKQEPYSPASYMMLRGLRWGELRGSSEPGILEPPPTELRQQVKALATRNKWVELLELSENIMALPCSRAWLDLQRLVVEACVALGDHYFAIAVAIRSELRALLHDLPNLAEAMLSDDTPAANPQTQAWLREIAAEPAGAVPETGPPKLPVMEGTVQGWEKKFVDAHTLALDAMRAGQGSKAISILQKELDRQLSGRGRFLRKLQLAQICIAAGKDTIAQPLLDDLAAVIETHKLEDWESHEMIAGALTFLVQNSKKLQADAKAKQAIFERICRLDPVQALSM